MSEVEILAPSGEGGQGAITGGRLSISWHQILPAVLGKELSRQAKEITGMNWRQDPVDIKHVLFGEYGESMNTEIMHTTHISANPRYWSFPATIQVY